MMVMRKCFPYHFYATVRLSSCLPVTVQTSCSTTTKENKKTEYIKTRLRTLFLSMLLKREYRARKIFLVILAKVEVNGKF